MSLFKKVIEVRIDESETSLFIFLTINGRNTARMNCVKQSDGKLLIGDIPPYRKSKDYNKGYGSKMMIELLRYAKDAGIHTIWGHLSKTDADHKDRLHAFYKKHGFTIIEYDTPIDQNYGEVIKRLVEVTE